MPDIGPRCRPIAGARRERLDAMYNAALSSDARCPECSGPIDIRSTADGDSRCSVCIDRSLRAVDAEFLDNYARLGARSHQVVAEACLKGLVLSDTADRKLLAMTVYEQFVAAAADFIGLYHALLDRQHAPIIRGVLGFELTAEKVRRFFEVLAVEGPTEMLNLLGLPHPDQVAARAGSLDARERKQVRAALREALGDLDRLIDYRTVCEQALVGAAQRLHGLMALTDKTAWLPGRQAAPGQIAALALHPNGHQVEVDLLNTDEETLGAVVDGVDVLTRLVRNIIFAFVSLHSAEEFSTGFNA